MIINSQIFGEVNYDLKEGVYLTKEIALNEGVVNCALYVEEDFFNDKEDLLKEAFKSLDKLEILEQSARKKLTEEKDDNEAIQTFIEFHLDELKDVLGQALSKNISPHNFLDYIELRSVNLFNDGGDGFIIQLDFQVQKELSDEILVVNFDKFEKIVSITHES